MNKKLVTIIVPVFNEEKNLNELYTRILNVIELLNQYDFEVIFIDNNSQDNSRNICIEICGKSRFFSYLKFTRNFGIEASFLAGAEHANGECLIYLFSDLQDPPELIPELLLKWESGNDVVYGVLKKREDNSFSKSIGAYLAYRLIYILSDVKIPINATDYRLISRPVINALLKCPEKNRYMRGITHWLGFKQTSFEFTRVPRQYGKSSAGLIWCIKYAFNAIFSFSIKPVRVATFCGLFLTFLSIFGAIFYTLLTILTRNNVWHINPPPTGISTIVFLIFFFGGMQFLFLGILGEYIIQINTESKARPSYIINEIQGGLSKNVREI